MADVCYRCQLRFSPLVQSNTKITSTQQRHDSVSETGEHNIAAQLFTITLSQRAVSLLSGCRGSLPGRPWGSECRLSKILHRSFFFLIPLKLPKRFMSCNMHPCGSSCRSCPGLEKKKNQHKGQSEGLLTPKAQVWENKSPERQCGCKRSPAGQQFSPEVPGSGLRGELSCSRLLTLARQALPALIPACRNCPASLCGHGEKFKVCPACSHRALIHQLSEALETKTTFPSGSAHVEKVRSRLISSLV